MNNRPSYIVIRSTARLSTFFFLLAIAGAIVFINKAPMIVLGTGGLFLLIGVPGLIYATRNMANYRDVFDYEPTEFRGKPSTGGQARTVLLAVNTLSLWCVFAALIILLIAWMHFA